MIRISPVVAAMRFSGQINFRLENDVTADYGEGDIKILQSRVFRNELGRIAEAHGTAILIEQTAFHSQHTQTAFDNTGKLSDIFYNSPTWRYSNIKIDLLGGNAREADKAAYQLLHSRLKAFQDSPELPATLPQSALTIPKATKIKNFEYKP